MLDLRKLKVFKERVIKLKLKQVIPWLKPNELNMIFPETVHCANYKIEVRKITKSYFK